MILVDTSVWIEWLGRRHSESPSANGLVNLVTCGPVVQEVLQGLRPGPQAEALRERFLALPRLSDPLPLRLFLAAADLYQLGRSKGWTIRSSVDCLIAAIAIEHHVPVWHRNRDFAAIARYTPLQEFERG